VRIVSFKREVLILESKKVFNVRIQLHHRQGAWLTGELQFRLIEMIFIEVQIPKGMDKVAGLKAADLCDHEGEKRVTGDVKGNPKKEVGTTLVELAAEFSVCDKKLK
jgi:hypothetical protein